MTLTVSFLRFNVLLSPPFWVSANWGLPLRRLCSSSSNSSGTHVFFDLALFVMGFAQNWCRKGEFPTGKAGRVELTRWLMSAVDGMSVRPPHPRTLANKRRKRSITYNAADNTPYFCQT